MHFQQPNLGRQTTLLAIFVSFLFPLSSMALNPTLKEIERKSSDAPVNGTYWFQYKIDGKTVISDVLQFGQTTGVFYAQEIGKPVLPVFFHQESSRFYVKAPASDARWLQNTSEKMPYFARDRKLLRDLGHLLLQRLPQDEDVKEVLLKNFDYGRVVEPKFSALGKSSAAVFELRVAASPEEMVEDFLHNPGKWDPAADEGCTDQGCVYKHRIHNWKFLVSPNLKELVYFEKPEVTNGTEIVEVSSQKQIEEYFEAAAASGARFVVINVGRLDTCPHCVTLHGTLKKFVKKRKDVCVIHIHKQRHPELAQSFGYDGNGLPWTLVFDLRGRTVRPKHGHHSKSFRLTKSLEELDRLMTSEE